MSKSILFKFGGTSLASPEKIERAADKIKGQADAGLNVLCVVSAMGNSTEELLRLGQQISGAEGLTRFSRESDLLLSAGERISMALMSLALNKRGLNAEAFTGSQAGIITNEKHGQAHIKDVRPVRIKALLEKKGCPIVAGFQGVSCDGKNVTTLGRGGSDTTAMALAEALDVDAVYIASDVSGYLSADPRIVSSAQHLRHLKWDHALELSQYGAVVMHARAVELAKKHRRPFSVFHHLQKIESGTMIGDLNTMTNYEEPAVLAMSYLENLYVYSFPGQQYWGLKKTAALEDDGILSIYLNNNECKIVSKNKLNLEGAQTLPALINIVGNSLVEHQKLTSLLGELKVDSFHLKNTSCKIFYGLSDGKALYQKLHQSLIGPAL